MTTPSMPARGADWMAWGQHIDAHPADTTNVHGITDTTVLATDAEVAAAVSAHSVDTTDVHGIVDTKLLARTLLPGGFVAGQPDGTRRAQFAFGGGGDTITGIGFLPDASQRMPIILPVNTTRWRFRVRNARADNTSVVGAFNFNGVWVGKAATGTDGLPNGAFTATPVQALGAFSTPENGATDTVSAWVTAPNAQFTAGALSMISMGWTTAATSIARGYGAMFYGFNDADAGLQGAPGNLAANVQLDVRIEYEFVGTNRIGIVLGDSLTEAFAADTTMMPYNTWHQRFSQRNRIPVCSSAAYGYQASDFSSPSAWVNTRWSGSGLTIDFAIIQLGSNDASSTVTLALYQSRIQGVVTQLRNLGIQDIYFNTIAPRNFATASEDLRKSYNAWLRRQPFNAQAVFEVDRALATPTNALVLLPEYATPDGTHWTPQGHHRVAEAISGTVITG